MYASSLARGYNDRPPPTEKVALGRGGTPFEFTRHADHARPSAQSMRGLYDPGYIFHSPSIVFNTLFVGILMGIVLRIVFCSNRERKRDFIR